jgi:hypothetical protein
MLQVCGLSLTRLELLISLVQLGLEVVDIALGSGQLILSVLQSGANVVEEVNLGVTGAISPHQLIIQLIDMRLKAGVLLEKLSIALLNVIDGMVLGLHLADVLLQVEVQVSICHYDLLKQGAHMLGVACHERPTRVVGQKLGVANGNHVLIPHRVALVPNREQGDGGVTEDRQVVLIELGEGLVSSPLQSVIEVIDPNCGEPSRHGRVGGVSRNVHMDLAMPMSELTVRVTMVCGNPLVAKAVQQVPMQDGKTVVVQPVTTEPSIGYEGGVGVVVHLSKIREKRINISSIKQGQQPKLQINHHNKTLAQILIWTDDDLAKLC